MILLDLINGCSKEVIVYSAIAFGVLVAVLIAVSIDLFFGIRKSKTKGNFIHSFGLKRTINKLVEYLAMLVMMFLGDFINPMWLVLDFPKIPVLTVIGGFVLIYIEHKSVREKSHRKFVNATAKAPREIIRYIVENKNLVKEIMEDVEDLNTKQK